MESIFREGKRKIVPGPARMRLDPVCADGERPPKLETQEVFAGKQTVLDGAVEYHGGGRAILLDICEIFGRFEEMRIRIFLPRAYHKLFVDIAAVVAKPWQDGSAIAIKLAGRAAEIQNFVALNPVGVRAEHVYFVEALPVLENPFLTIAAG